MKSRVLMVLGLGFMAACSSASGETSAADQMATAAHGEVQEPSKKLSALLFDDADPSTFTDYVLFGTLPASSEACSTTIHRRGLHPNRYSWSSIAIHPFGASANAIEEHGPVDESWATTPEQSGDREAIASSGNVTTFTRTDRDTPANKLVLKLTFATADGGWDEIQKAEISGIDTIGTPRNATCENLHVGIVMKPEVFAPIANAAAKAWAQENGEDLEEEGIELESCGVSSTTSVGCFFGNETNEETLSLDFELTNGEIGRMTNADRESEFGR